MKTLTNGHITLSMLLCATTFSLAQIHEPYDQLDLAGATSHFFFPQTYHDWPVPSPQSYDTPLNGMQAAKLFYNFDNACLDSNYCIGEDNDFKSVIDHVRA